jgi:ATP adenylyltransferase
MDRLWAPWRIAYVQGTGKKREKQRCIFCDAAKGGHKQHVLFTTGRSIAILNIFPYNNGHIMVAPLRHTGQLSSLSPEEALDLFDAVSRVMRVLDRIIKPAGYNVGANIGRAAGAGIPGHLHLHIVPRWNGDTNFMPVVNSTKVISQSLEELHTRFMKADR